jgi:UDP-N-acetyl-D-galactosamine dehydrogenase
MGEYAASQTVKQMIRKGIPVKDSNILILGITFKENCPDVRNTKVVDIVSALREYGANITIYDPWANPEEVKHEYGLDILTEMPEREFDAVVLAVAHREFERANYNGMIIYRVKF